MLKAIALWEDRAEPFKQTLPFKSWDQLACGVWRECNSCLGCSCWRYYAQQVAAFYSYEGNNSSHRHLAIFEKRVGAVLSIYTLAAQAGSWLPLHKPPPYKTPHDAPGSRTCPTAHSLYFGPNSEAPRSELHSSVQIQFGVDWMQSCKAGQMLTLALALLRAPGPAAPGDPLLCCLSKVRLVTEKLEQCFCINSY